MRPWSPRLHGLTGRRQARRCGPPARCHITAANWWRRRSAFSRPTSPPTWCAVAGSFGRRLQEHLRGRGRVDLKTDWRAGQAALGAPHRPTLRQTTLSALGGYRWPEGRPRRAGKGNRVASSLITYGEWEAVLPSGGGIGSDTLSFRLSSGIRAPHHPSAADAAHGRSARSWRHILLLGGAVVSR